MNARFSNFIVINDGHLKDYYFSKGKYRWIENGYIIYPVGVGIPIIDVAARKCAGIGTITEIVIDDSTTKIIFEATNIDADMARAYYSLYMQGKSMMESDSSYDTDVFIPGAMGLGPMNTKLQQDKFYEDDDDLSLSERMRRMKR